MAGRIGTTTLRLRVAAGRGDLLPPSGLPVRHQWRGVDAGVYAYGYTDEHAWWLRWPKVGTFRMVPAEADVAVVPEDGVPAGVLQDAFRRGVTPVALLQRDFEVLHASAVLVDQRVIALCAVSGTGKSTLATALSRHGAVHWADDFVAWTLGTDDVQCDWFPSDPRLCDDAMTVLDGVAASTASRTPVRAPLGAIVILERGSPGRGQLASLATIPPNEAFTAVLAHAHECGLGGATRHRASVACHLELAGRVPIFRLVFEPDLARLGELASDVHTQLRAVVQ